MSLLNLSTYPAIQTNMFVYLNAPGGALAFSDYHKPFVLNSINYTGLGSLLSISNTISNLRSTSDTLAIAISGIPTSSINSIVTTKLKGSKITVYRAFFNPVTGSFITMSGNPSGKFIGVVNNYNIEDNLDQGSDTGSIVLTLSCTSDMELLSNKVSGRRTNPIDEKTFFPNDKSFDRVPALIRSNFQFGAPTK